MWLRLLLVEGCGMRLHDVGYNPRNSWIDMRGSKEILTLSSQANLHIVILISIENTLSLGLADKCSNVHVPTRRSVSKLSAMYHAQASTSPLQELDFCRC